MLPARVPPDATRVARARPRRPLGQAHVNCCLCFIDSLCHSTAPAFFRARIFLAVCSSPHRNVLVRGGQRSPSLHRQERRDDDRASAGGHEPAPRRARERHRPRRSGTRAQPRHPSHTPLPGRARARDARPATADGGRGRWRSVPAFLIIFVLNRATGGAILRVHASSRAPRDVCLSPAVRRPAPNPPPNPPRAAAATPPGLLRAATLDAGACEGVIACSTCHIVLEVCSGRLERTRDGTCSGSLGRGSLGGRFLRVGRGDLGGRRSPSSGAGLLARLRVLRA